MNHVTWWHCLLLGSWLLASSGCRSPYFVDQGAAVGGLAGGLTGAALGDHHGNAFGGAVLGTAVGALTGAAIGSSMDAEVERRQALIEARTGRRMAGRVTTNDVMTLSLSGVGDDVIVNHIRANGVAAPLTPRDIIQLHEAGVSEAVINAMQQSAATPPPVIIQESYVVPSYWGPRYHTHLPVRPCPPPVHRGPRRVGWGVSVWN